MADYDYTSPSESDRIQRIFDRKAEGLLYNRDDLEKMKHRKWWKEFFTTNPFYANPEEEAEKRRQWTAFNEWNDKFKRQYGAPPPLETSSEPKMKVELPPVPANGTADDDPGPLAGRHGPIFTGTSASAPPTTDGPLENEKGMPGWGSMPMNMGLLQLGAGMLSQSGWQDDDVSPGQAFGKAMPGAMSSYMTGVKSLQDRDLYQAKMHDILAAREREKGLKESLPGVIDNLKGKISGIPDERLEVIKSLVKSSPKQALQIVSNLASTASGGKYLYETASPQDEAAGFKPGSIIQIDPNTGERTLFGKEEPGEIKTHEIPGGVYLTQDGKYLQTLGTSKSSKKTDLELVDSRPWSTLIEYQDRPDSPEYRAAYYKLSNRVQDITDPNDPTRTIRVPMNLPREFPVPGSPAPKTTDQELPDSVNVENLKYGGRIFEEMRDKYGFKGDMDQFVEYLNENVTHPKGGLWTQDIMPSEIPITGDQWGPKVEAAPKKLEDTAGRLRKASEVESKSTKFSGRMVNSSNEIDKMYSQGYRPSWTVFENLERKIIEQKSWTDRAIEEELIPGMQLSQDDKKFIRYALDFVTADLRSESGAAIKDSEIVNGLKRHFEKPTLENVRRGNMPSNELLNTARVSRINAIKGMIEMSGGFYKGPGIETLMSKDSVFGSSEAQKQLDEWEYKLQQNPGLKTIEVD
tara:strand:+ start:6794 stop:8863 length:2070 start_codon:yes stop_codon:yes gene_type:complete